MRLGRWVSSLLAVVGLAGLQAGAFAQACNGTGACVVQLGGVYAKGCGDKRYIAAATGMVRVVNALNDGKGFGIKAGNAGYTHFFRFNFSYATYDPVLYDDVGAALAADLFPRLDFVVGQGAHCGAEDANTLKMAQIAEQHRKIYFTQRGPSGFMTAAPTKRHIFSSHLNSDEYATPAIRRYSLSGVTSAALISTNTENYFFNGLTNGVRKDLEENRIQLVVETVLEMASPRWVDQVEEFVSWAVGNRTEVLLLTCSTTEALSEVMKMVKMRQYEHVFKSIWMGKHATLFASLTWRGFSRGTSPCPVSPSNIGM